MKQILYGDLSYPPPPIKNTRTRRRAKPKALEAWQAGMNYIFKNNIKE